MNAGRWLSARGLGCQFVSKGHAPLALAVDATGMVFR